MPEWMIYVVLVLFPVGTVFFISQYRDVRRRTLTNYPGAQPELFAEWQAAYLRGLKGIAILCGVMSGVNLILYFARIGVAGPGLLFFVVLYLINREPNREAARLAREIGLTTKAVIYVKNP